MLEFKKKQYLWVTYFKWTSKLQLLYLSINWHKYRDFHLTWKFLELIKLGIFTEMGKLEFFDKTWKFSLNWGNLEIFHWMGKFRNFSIKLGIFYWNGKIWEFFDNTWNFSLNWGNLGVFYKNRRKLKNVPKNWNISRNWTKRFLSTGT